MPKVIFNLALILFCFLFSACGDSNTIHTGEWSNASLVIDNIIYPQVSVKIAVDGNGNSIAVYNQSDGIYSMNFDTRLGWSTPQKIADNTELYVYFNNLHMAVNDRGDAIVAWLHDQIGNNYIQTVRYTSGSGWGTPQQLISPNMVFSLNVALDSNSSALVVWEGYDSLDVQRHTFVSRSLQASGWETPQMISANPWDANSPQIAVDNAGNALAMWEEWQYTNGIGNVFVSRFTVNSGWSSPQLIASNPSSAAWMDIAFDKSGNAMSVWSQSDSSNHYHIYSCRYNVESGWENAVVVDNNTLDSIGPALTLDSSGNFRSAWVQVTGTGSDIYTSRYTAAYGWEASQLIGTGGYASSPRVATDGVGNVFAAWQQYDPNDIYPGDAKVYANRYSSVSGWSKQRQLKNALGGADVPELAVNSNGYATVIWLQDTGYTFPGSLITKYGIFASRFQ